MEEANKEVDKCYWCRKDVEAEIKERRKIEDWEVELDIERLLLHCHFFSFVFTGFLSLKPPQNIFLKTLLVNLNFESLKFS